MNYSRAFMRKHYASGYLISNDGLHGERDYYDQYSQEFKTQILYQYLDPAEDRYFMLSGKDKYYIDEMVLSCYRGTIKDGKQYLVHHKDGDMRNSRISNLEWREATPEYLQERQKIIADSIAASAIKDAEAKKKALMDRYKRNKIEVNKNGQITQYGKAVFLEDSFYDSDLDWTYHTDNARVRLSIYIPRWRKTDYERFDVVDIMEDFGMIEGNKADFANPKVLYKNHNYLDTTPGNMAWCDASDQRYIDFKTAAHEVVMEKDHHSNYYLSEQSWKTIYGPDEPYRDWSDRPPVRHLCFG